MIKYLIPFCFFVNCISLEPETKLKQDVQPCNLEPKLPKSKDILWEKAQKIISGQDSQTKKSFTYLFRLLNKYIQKLEIITELYKRRQTKELETEYNELNSRITTIKNYLPNDNTKFTDQEIEQWRKWGISEFGRGHHED
jgi:hypothetical protein